MFRLGWGHVPRGDGKERVMLRLLLLWIKLAALVVVLPLLFLYLSAIALTKNGLWWKVPIVLAAWIFLLAWGQEGPIAIDAIGDAVGWTAAIGIVGFIVYLAFDHAEQHEGDPGG